MSRVDDYNKARREKMKLYDCWSCNRLDHCNPFVECFVEKIKNGNHKGNSDIDSED